MRSQKEAQGCSTPWWKGTVCFYLSYLRCSSVLSIMPVLGLETGQKLVVLEARPGLFGLRRDADLTLFWPALGWASSQFSFTSPQHGSVSAEVSVSWPWAGLLSSRLGSHVTWIPTQCFGGLLCRPGQPQSPRLDASRKSGLPAGVHSTQLTDTLFLASTLAAPPSGAPFRCRLPEGILLPFGCSV